MTHLLKVAVAVALIILYGRLAMINVLVHVSKVEQKTISSLYVEYHIEVCKITYTLEYPRTYPEPMGSYLLRPPLPISTMKWSYCSSCSPPARLYMPLTPYPHGPDNYN